VTHPAPLVIGATGGSGTRVVARLAQRAGYNLGTNLNTSEDAVSFRSFHDSWINRFVATERSGHSLSAGGATRMEQAFESALAEHRSTTKTEELRWGWKAPRTIYLLPFIHAHFPDCKFIHVLRDGRDMAFSKNQNQLRKHGRAVLNWSERWLNPAPLRSILLWERVNLPAAEYGETRLKENYHRVRFEDLCYAPVRTIEGIMQFLGVEIDINSAVQAEISPPLSIGRWRHEPPQLVARLERAAVVSLRKFGYLG
jgi:Sulfotransferase family